jgi:hypothetical protein
MSTTPKTQKRTKEAVPAEPEPTVRISSSDLKRTLTNAMLFASADQSRPVLNTVRLGTDGTTLTAESTDSYLMFRESVKLRGSQAEYQELLLSLVNVRVLNAAIDQGQEIQLFFEADEVRAVVDKILSVTLPTANGKYPATDDIRNGWKPGRDIYEFAFGPKLLAKVTKIKVYGFTPYLKFTLGEDESKPIRVTVGKDIEVLIMPGRLSAVRL